jgi:hypothetical protein
MPQTEEQKIRSRLRSYERKLQKEKKEHGFYRPPLRWSCDSA